MQRFLQLKILIFILTLNGIAAAQKSCKCSIDTIWEIASESKNPELGIPFVDSVKHCEGYIYYFPEKDLCIYKIKRMDDYELYFSGSFFTGDSYRKLDMVLLADTFLVEQYYDKKNGSYGKYLIKVDIPNSNLDSLDVYGTVILDSNYYLIACYADTFGLPIVNYVVANQTDYYFNDGVIGTSGFGNNAFDIDTTSIYRLNNGSRFITRSAGHHPPARSVVYTDSSKNKELYQRLQSYSSQDAKITYKNMMKEISGKKKFNLNKKLLKQLPKELMELNLYKSSLYLYAPNDWGTLGKASITNSTFVDYNMDGPWPKVIKSIEESSPGVYKLDLVGQGFTSQIIIRVLDMKSGLYLIGHSNEEIIIYDRIFCDANKMYSYPSIVNYSPKGKTREFRFDVPDYNLLIDKYK
jgi:hypothetical protein